MEEKFDKINIVSPKTLTNYYNKYVENRNNKAGKPNYELSNLIAYYLGFENYVEFEKFYSDKKLVSKNVVEASAKSTKEIIKSEKNRYHKNIDNRKKSIKKYIIGLSVLLIVPIFFLINKYNNSNLETCVIWQKDRFKVSSCKNVNTIDNTFYNIDIKKFKKVIVNEETIFFNNGKPIIW